MLPEPELTSYLQILRERELCRVSQRPLVSVEQKTWFYTTVGAMQLIVLEWGMGQHVLHTAVRLFALAIDACDVPWDNDHVMLLGCTSVWMTFKFSENDNEVLDAKEVADIVNGSKSNRRTTDYTKYDVIKQERSLLRLAAQTRCLTEPTIYTFRSEVVNALQAIVPFNGKKTYFDTTDLAMFIMDAVVSNHDIISKFLPSVVVASAFDIAAKITGAFMDFGVSDESDMRCVESIMGYVTSVIVYGNPKWVRIMRSMYGKQPILFVSQYSTLGMRYSRKRGRGSSLSE